MSYQFYRTAGETGLYGASRTEPYALDGHPAPLPPDTIEVEVVYQPHPELTPTQKATRTQVLDGSTYTFGWEVSEMSDEEIQATIPSVCNAQLKLWLIESGHLDPVRAIVNNAADPVQKLKLQTEFQSRTIIQRSNAMVETVRVAMGWSHDFVNNLFREASLL